MEQKINILVDEYVEKRMETLRNPYHMEAIKKIEEMTKYLGSKERIHQLTEGYFGKTEKPTLIGLQRYCQMRK